MAAMRFTALLLILAVNTEARQPVRAKHGMVVAQEPNAAEAGLKVASRRKCSRRRDRRGPGATRVAAKARPQDGK